MDQMLNIPKDRPRKSAIRLPILLGLTVLLFVLVLIPLQPDRTEAPAETAGE